MFGYDAPMQLHDCLSLLTLDLYLNCYSRILRMHLATSKLGINTI